MKNPLYPHKIITDELLNKYNRCLVITLRKHPIPIIFDKDINYDSYYYDDIKHNYSIKCIPMWIIKLINKKINFIIFEMDEDILLNFNFEVYTINNERISYNLSEAVLLIPNHTWNWVYNYIEPYVKDGIYDMYKYITNSSKSLSELFSSDDYYELYNNINSSLDVKYWKDISKCRINITTAWLLRDINFSDAKEINISKQLEMDVKCNDYLSDMINKHKYVDASSGLKTHNYSLYYIDEPTNVPIDNMIEKLLCNMFDETIKQKIDQELKLLINYCLLSKKYCHIILKNKNVINYIKHNMSTFSKSFSYTWLMMYIEEGILKSMIKETDRCIFTLEQACQLPNKEEYKNMYLPMMVEKKYINMFGGYKSIRNPSIILSSMDIFKKRLNIFSNYNDIDIFKNLDWTNIAITGSVIPASCRVDPMEIDGGYKTTEYFDTYYNDSDIDVMISGQNQTSFIDRVCYFVSVIEANILEKYPMKGFVEVEIHKTANLHINQTQHNDIKITQQFAYDLYCKLKEKEEKYSEEKYKMINTVCSIDHFKYYVYHDNENSKDVNYVENIKFHVVSPFLKRKFEIFKVKYNFLSTVSRFHLPCVRGYYNGKDVYLLPSAVSALLTNKCMDYKYFAGVRSPFEIILKYNFRGFSIMLNKKEMIKMLEYIKNTEKWSKIFNYDVTFKTNTINKYYTNPYVFLNKPNIKYIDYLTPIEHDVISPIVSLIGYIIPYSN
jgi:hypothetical protein